MSGLGKGDFSMGAAGKEDKAKNNKNIVFINMIFNF